MSNHNGHVSTKTTFGLSQICWPFYCSTALQFHSVIRVRREEHVKNKVFNRCNIWQVPLEPTQAHQGQGQIEFHRILTQANIKGACHFMDFTRMPPGSSIGLHRHEASEEEYYLILEGSGLMQQDGVQFRVRAGDLIRNPPGGQHGLTNDTDQALHLFVFELKVQP